MSEKNNEEAAKQEKVKEHNLMVDSANDALREYDRMVDSALREYDFAAPTTYSCRECAGCAENVGCDDRCHRDNEDSSPSEYNPNAVPDAI